MTSHRKIIGIGSPFGADQLGWQAIDMLRKLPLSDWELVSLDRPGSDLIRHFEGVDDLVLIDAVQGGLQPGVPRLLQRVDLATTECRTSTHGFGVVEALEVAEQLGLLPDKTRIIGVETGPEPSVLPEIPLNELLDLLDLETG